MKEEVIRVLLWVRSALVGEIPDTLRAIAINIRKNPYCNDFDLLLEINYFYEREQNEDYLEDFRCVTTEATASLQLYLDEQLIRTDVPKQLQDNLQYAYLRYEENLPSFKREKFVLEEFFPGYLALVMGEALLGKVTKELVYVYGDLRENRKVLCFYFYHFDPISEEVRKMWQEAINEASDTLQQCLPHRLDSKIEKVDCIPRDKSEEPFVRCVFCKKNIPDELFEKE